MSFLKRSTAQQEYLSQDRGTTVGGMYATGDSDGRTSWRRLLSISSEMVTASVLECGYPGPRAIPRQL